MAENIFSVRDPSPQCSELFESLHLAVAALAQLHREGIGGRYLPITDRARKALDAADPHIDMRPIRVYYDDGQTSITYINGSRRSINEYYLGTYFEYDEEKPTHKAVRVEFLERDAG